MGGLRRYTDINFLMYRLILLSTIDTFKNSTSDRFTEDKLYFIKNYLTNSVLSLKCPQFRQKERRLY